MNEAGRLAIPSAAFVTALEIAAALAAATVLVAVGREVLPAAELTLLYLPAVLVIAGRRGALAGLVTSVMGVGCSILSSSSRGSASGSLTRTTSSRWRSCSSSR